MLDVCLHTLCLDFRLALPAFIPMPQVCPAPSSPCALPRQVVLVPPSLRSEELLPLLDPYRSYRVWRLTFGGVGSAQRAYSGFSRGEEARAFDRRMAHITTSWCCRCTRCC